MFILKQLTHGTFPALLLSLAFSLCLLHILSLGRLRDILIKLITKRYWFEMYSLLFFRNSYIYFTPFSGESWTVVLVLQGKDIQNKLCKGFEPKNLTNVTFQTQYPLAWQGSALWLCIITTHILEQSFHLKLISGLITCMSINLRKGAHAPPPTP